MTGPHAVVRADGSSAIGTGHIIRSGTLARALVARSWRVTFVAREMPAPLSAGLVADGIGIVALPEDSSVTSEPEVIARLVGSEVALIVADHYGIDASWYVAMRQRMPRAALLSIDDLADRPLPVDLVLNQNMGMTAASYAALVPASSVILTGPHYALVRPEFASLRERGRARDGQVERLLVFISGADVPDVTRRAAEALAGIDRPVDVVVGAAYPHMTSLRAAVARHPGTIIHVNTHDMATLMERADLAVGAASSASWERCTLGLPAVLVTLADNQADTARLLDEAGAAVAIGWHTTVTAQDIERTVRDLCGDLARVKAMSAAAAAITDGRGTERVVAEIESMQSRRRVQG
jgi:UDP-2,4-diacetamido-2,4,6-trideoxy-beta-L-altropyranose hydrolase